MSTLALGDKHTKELLKQALAELTQERRDLFEEIIEEEAMKNLRG